MRSDVLAALVASVLVAGCAASSGSSEAPTCPEAAIPSAPPVPPAPPVSAEPTPTLVDSVAIPARPDWTDKYAGSVPGEQRRMNVSKIMERWGLDRQQAIEVQNLYLDATRAEPAGDRDAQLEAVAQRVRAGEFETPRRVEAIAKADFVVVFDLDETLYDQYGVEADCADLHVPREGKGAKEIRLNPAWKTTIERIHRLGGAVVVFSANLDSTNLENLGVWILDEKPLYAADKISGLLTNSHLVQQEASEGVSDPRKGSPVQEPSKDMRQFDEELNRVILVDDNPDRTFQPRNLRVFKKFDGQAYCDAKDKKVKKAYERSLTVVGDEIEESIAYARKAKVPFVQAYAPYTAIGRVALDWLVDGAGMSKKRAIAHLRTNPELIDHEW